MKPQPLRRKGTSIITLLVLLQLSFMVSLSIPSAGKTPQTTTIAIASQLPNSNFTSGSVSNSTLNSILENPPVSIDQSLFIETVPNYPNIGQNYTVKVLVNNNSDQPIPVYFRVEAPIQVFTVHPIYVAVLVPPNGQVTGNFTLVAFNGSFKGAVNVSTVLYIWYYHQMNQPQQVQQSSTFVYGVHPYQYSQIILTLLVLLIIVPAGLAVAYHWKSGKKTTTVTET